MRIIDVVPAASGFCLVLHGGVASRASQPSSEDEQLYSEGLAEAYRAGQTVLASGGSAVDAVCAAVVELENCVLFNAGRGAALTANGDAELDASVMTGDGRAGAVAVTRRAKNPVLAARGVLEETHHVLLVAPGEGVLAGWALETVDPEYFVTESRRQQLEKVRTGELAQSRHGTVGAVAVEWPGEWLRRRPRAAS